MTDHPLQHGIDWVLSPIGGAAIGLLFYPMGCGVAQLVCPAGERVNFLGWTMGGMVGNVTEAGAFFIGVAVAAILWLLLDQVRKPSS